MSSDDSRSHLLAGIRGRRQEIGKAVLSRVLAIGPTGRADPEYRDGLRLAAETAIDHTIDALEGRFGATLPLPGPLPSQARLAARHRVPLEVMLRRYLAGHIVLGDIVIEESERLHLPAGVLRWALRMQAVTTDQALAAISAAYTEEAATMRPRSGDERQAELVGRLLDGELIDPALLNYGFDRWHIGLIFRGHAKSDAVDVVTGALDIRRLVVAAEDGCLWAWLGTREKLEPGVIAEVAEADLPSDIRLGIGEPAWGRDGWRLTHEQARAALTVAIRRTETAARYVHVALLASAMQDELFTRSLRQLYLVPLGEGQDRDGVLRKTVGAYLATHGNVTSAAAALAVDRRTVANRLRAAEERIGRSLDGCVSELELALQLDHLDHPDAR